jgi:hypothetical protein
VPDGLSGAQIADRLAILDDIRHGDSPRQNKFYFCCRNACKTLAANAKTVGSKSGSLRSLANHR